MQQDVASPNRPLASGRSRFAGARRAPVSAALVAINVAIYGLEELWGGGNGATLVRMGALYNGDPALLRWERLVTYGYLHGGPLHVGMNMLALWSLGRALEPVLGASRFFTLYTLSLLGGGVAIALSPKLQLTVGASGAIFGLLGAVCAVYLRRYRQNDSESERRAIRGSIGRLLLPNLMISLLPQVSLLGHGGGLVVGGVYMQMAIWRFARDKARAQEHTASGRAFNVTLLAAACVALTLYCLAAVWITYTPWQHGG